MTRLKNLKNPDFPSVHNEIEVDEITGSESLVSMKAHTSAAKTGFKPEVAIIKWPKG